MTTVSAGAARHGALAAGSSSSAASPFPAPRLVWLAKIAPRLWTEWSMWRVNRWVKTLSDEDLDRLIRETRAFLDSRSASCGR